MIISFCDEKKLFCCHPSAIADQVKRWAYSKRLALVLAAEGLLLVFYIITPIELKQNIGSGQIDYRGEIGRFSTENLEADAGDYEVLLKYCTEEDKEILFYPYGEGDSYPAVLEKDQKELRFPLHLDQATSKMRFEFGSSIPEKFEIKKILLIKQSYGRGLHDTLPILFLLMSAIVVFFWPYFKPEKMTNTSG